MINLIIGIINYISLPLVNILLLPKITHNIDPIVYGKYTLYNNILSIVILFSFLGVYPTIIQRYLNKKYENYFEYKKILYFLNIVSLFIYFIISIILLKLYSNILILVLLLNYLFGNLTSQIVTFYIVNGEINKSNKIKLYNIICYISVLILYIHLKTFSIYSIILGNLIYNIIIILYNFKIFKRLNQIKNINLLILKEIIEYSIPLLFIGISGVLLYSGDRYMIKLILKNSDYWIGIYSIQYTIYSQIFNLIVQLYYLYIPSKLYICYEKEGIEKFIKKLNLWIESYLHSSLVIIIILVLTYPKINKILLSENYNINLNFAIYIILGGFLFGLYRLMGEVLNMLKKTKILNLAIWSSGIINIVLNYFFIGRLGIKGAAITTFISYFFLTIVIYIIILRKIKKPILTLKQIYILIVFILSVIFIDNFEVKENISENKVKILFQVGIEVILVISIYLVIFRKKIAKILKEIVK